MHLSKFFVLFLLFITLGSALEALPAQVILIPHAEKEPESVKLSLLGQERAAALALYFLGTPDVMKFGPPVAIFAQKPGPQDKSLRSIETVNPLAKTLNLQPNVEYENMEYLEMATAVLSNPAYSGKAVLICWEQQAIPEIARAFGAIDAPKKWQREAFDRTWVITYRDDGSVTFENLPQRLMYGDSSQ
jgi:hypothetical protein